MRESGFIVSSVVVLGACSVAFAGPEVMDFQSLEHVNNLNVSHGNPVIEDSFKVTSDASPGFFSWGTLEAHYAGSTGLFHLGNKITLSKVGGGSFSIQSIDLAQWNANSGAATPVNFVGTFSGGGTISMGVSIPASVGSPSFVTHAFNSAWTGLSMVEWTESSPYHQFDNIVLDNNPVIPLPTGAAMAMVGMGVIGVRRRRS